MKQRNIMAVILFSIITLGIYDLFWLVKTKKTLNEKTDVHTPSIWLLFAPYIILVLGVFLVAGLTGGGAKDGGEPGAGFAAGILIFELLAFLLIIPITFYWFFKFSKAVNHFTHGELNTAITFILLWILRFIGIAIIQDKFNDMLAAGAGQPGQPIQPQAAGMPGSPFPPAPGAIDPRLQQPQPFQQPQPQQFMPPQPPVTPTVENPWPQQPQAPAPGAPQPPQDENQSQQPPQPPVPPVVQ